jgi:hypothetical protein
VNRYAAEHPEMSDHSHEAIAAAIERGDAHPARRNPPVKPVTPAPTPNRQSFTSQSNPILAKCRADSVRIGIRRAVGIHLSAISWGEWSNETTLEQRRHARRVLSKLEALA